MNTHRIVMDHQAFALQARGGVSRIFAEIAKHIRQPKMDMAVWAGLHINEYVEGIRNNADVRTIGCRVPRRIGKQRLLMPLNRPLFAAFARRWQPHAIHYTYYERTCRRSPAVREIITVHDMIHELFDQSPQVAAAKKRMAETVDGIICVSENTRHDLLKLYEIPSDRVRVIPHGNPMNGVKAAPPPPGLPERFVLFVGRRSGYKDFDVALQAMQWLAPAGLPDPQLVAFGGGAFSGDEVRRIAGLGLQGRVHSVLGDDPVLAALYERAHALVYPSRYEGFGLPPLEAMSRGCPVIVCRTSSLPEVVGPSGLYIEPGDVRGLADAMGALDEPAVRAEWAEKGSAQSRRFSWERCARETAEFYQEIICRPPRDRE
jgi:glycosyltransferase involved in cell wall biosynthesis